MMIYTIKWYFNEPTADELSKVENDATSAATLQQQPNKPQLTNQTMFATEQSQPLSDLESESTNAQVQIWAAKEMHEGYYRINHDEDCFSYITSDCIQAAHLSQDIFRVLKEQHAANHPDQQQLIKESQLAVTSGPVSKNMSKQQKKKLKKKQQKMHSTPFSEQHVRKKNLKIDNKFAL
jgi:hypothetical protein